MKTKGFTKMNAWAVVFSLVFMLGLTTAHAQQRFKFSGKGDYTLTDGKAFSIGDAEEHTVMLNKWEGKNISTGETEWMHNAQTFNFAFNDVKKGNGIHHGYVTLEEGSERIVAQYEGRIFTTLSGEGKPVTAFKGIMWWVEATGKYENMHGVVTYNGWFTSQNTYKAEWEGEFWEK